MGALILFGGNASGRFRNSRVTPETVSIVLKNTKHKRWQPKLPPGILESALADLNDVFHQVVKFLTVFQQPHKVVGHQRNFRLNKFINVVRLDLDWRWLRQVSQHDLVIVLRNANPGNHFATIHDNCYLREFLVDLHAGVQQRIHQIFV